jgi:hypothetical protein
MQMTPAIKAAEIVSQWTSDNYMHPSARPTIQKQIEQAIERDRHAVCLTILEAIDKDEHIGIHTKHLIAEHVMEALGIAEAELV